MKKLQKLTAIIILSSLLIAASYSAPVKGTDSFKEGYKVWFNVGDGLYVQEGPITQDQLEEGEFVEFRYYCGSRGPYLVAIIEWTRIIDGEKDTYTLEMQVISLIPSKSIILLNW